MSCVATGHIGRRTRFWILLMPVRLTHVAQLRYSDVVSRTAPASVRRMLRRGLALVTAGRAGKGLRGETVAWARDLADGLPISDAKARKMRAWFARHGAATAESARRMRDPESPAAVAWLLWGGDPSVAYRKTGWRDPVAAWLRSLPVSNPSKKWAALLPLMVVIPFVPPL
jgi:hypothetical protein